MKAPMRGWLAAAALLVVVAAELAWPGGRSVVAVGADAVAGAGFLAAGVLAAGRGPTHRFATLAALAGVAWFAANVVAGAPLLYQPLMVHAVLSYPDGRVRGRAAQVVLAAAWVAVLLPWPPVRAGASVALGIGVAVIARLAAANSPVARWRTAHAAARAAVLLGLAFAVPAALRLALPVSELAQPVATLHAALVAVAAGILIVNLLLHVLRSDALADDVVELTELRSHALAAVAASLHDGNANEVTDPAAAAALAAATDLLADNRRLHAALEAQVVEVRQSRRRIVEAADVERGRLARRLADSAGRHLADLEATLELVAALPGDEAAAVVARTLKELAGTRDDLDQMLAGLHPRLLLEEGLRAALQELGERAGVPAQVAVADTGVPLMAETTVWYVCAEAVANVSKHANACTLTITVTVDGDELCATVTDDGVGGARPAPGSGLAGLADRLDAVGGRLQVSDRTGGGTVLRAWVPAT